MSQLSLPSKIRMLAWIPLVLFAVFAFRSVYSSYTSYHSANSALPSLMLLNASSDFVHELQKERGLSAAFLSGADNGELVKKQRAKVDERIKAMLPVIDGSGFSEKYIKKVHDSVALVKQLRSKVDSKSISVADEVKQYTAVVKIHLSSASMLANHVHSAEIANRLVSLSMVESSKESGGKLRAMMSATFAADQPIGEKKLQKIINLHAGVEPLLRSGSAFLSEKGAKLVVKFIASDEWKDTNHKLIGLVTSTEQGEYGVDSKAFFATISGALNIVGELVKEQRREIRAVTEQIVSKSSTEFWIFSVFSLLSVVGLSLFSLYIVGNTSKILKSSIDSLEDNMVYVTSSSQSIVVSSHQLSSASNEQAAATQETASALEEVGSMLDKNSSAIDRAKAFCHQTNELTQTGRNAIQKMVDTVKSFEVSNGQFSDQMKETSEKLNHMTQLFDDIQKKTQVINDIVFQTRLLSFNASVEAARAGEHGKGFAVVAEEIGSLAQMSGQASVDIANILTESVNQVQEIVSETEQSTHQILERGNQQVETGLKNTEQFHQVFTEIFDNINAVDQTVEDMALAIREQLTGVHEINSAVHEIDRVTQVNSKAANEANDLARDLNLHADELETIVVDLMKMTYGEKSKKIEELHEQHVQQSEQLESLLSGKKAA